MGAEQIGFLLRGPRELDKNLRAQAVEAGIARMKYCAHLQDVESWDADERQWVRDNLNDDECDVEVVAGFDEAAVEEAVDAVYALWNEEISARDTNMRVDPFDENMALFFAGDQTWGDSPDGLGYSIMRDAMRLGFLNTLGIR